MNYINCPLCRNQTFKILYKSTLKKEDYQIKKLAKNLQNTLDNSKLHGQYVRCKKCSLVYVNPPEKMNLLSQGYKKVVDPTYLKMEKYRKILSNQHLKTILKFKKGKNILDVGCFTGNFLEIAKKRGWEVTNGIEPSKWAQSIARKRGLKIVGEELLKTKLPAHSYDVITLWDVIEHLENPNIVIKNLKKALKKDGLIALGTPDIDCWLAKIMRDNYPYLVRMHTILFSRKTLKKLLEQNGFQVLYTKSYGRTFPLSYIAERLFANGHSSHIINRIINKITFLKNMVITINLGDSFIMIAQKK